MAQAIGKWLATCVPRYTDKRTDLCHVFNTSRKIIWSIFFVHMKLKKGTKKQYADSKIGIGIRVFDYSVYMQMGILPCVDRKHPLLTVC